ncbi:MAG: lamin tail domain-containing protein, partial [Verrucomicrobia bacterium]|nr:lamin tail domain-containing protein [Verrucomicrobiota bacterium]
MRIHEVLTTNVVSAPVEGRFVDWIELQSMSSTPFSLAGWGITDDPARPFRYKFPPGTMMPSGALRVWQAEDELLSPTSLGFALDRDGSGVYLFDPGTNLMDSVVFGSQLEDLSIGRNNSGAWVLCTPTPFGANRPAVTGSPGEVMLNEWQVNGPLLSSFDFIELYNAGRHPVNLGGMHLTDELFGTPRRHRIADLTFIAPGGISLFFASGRPERGVAHLDFRLAAEQGMIALTDEAGQTVDSVVYGPQKANHSEGRIGGVKSTQSVFTQTTPGVPNAGPIVTGPGFTTQTLFPLVTSWLFAEGVSDFPTGWTLPGADVSAFRSGSAVLVDPFSTDLFSNFGTRFASWGDAGSKIFRKTFVVTNLPPNGRLLARGYIDDGAIFYLNGGYAGSVRMPPLEQVLSTTRAISSPVVRTAQETVELDASLLRVGTNVLAVQLHQTANDSLRATFGVHLELTAPVIREPVRNLRLNEVLAANSYIKNGADRTPDWVEIINPTTNDVDLAGMSLTDDLSQPRKWVFPSGVRLNMG